ncbi:MAG TPA: hypothetical protein VGF82_18785 [Terracidiphilus sp.]|jgi:hypothetical protein
MGKTAVRPAFPLPILYRRYLHTDGTCIIESVDQIYMLPIEQFQRLSRRNHSPNGVALLTGALSLRLRVFVINI